MKSFSKKKDLAMIDELGNMILDLLIDMDRILSTDPHFMMGRWISDARNMATNEQVSFEEKSLSWLVWRS